MTGPDRPRGRRWPWDALALVTALVVIMPPATLAYYRLAIHTEITSSTYQRPIAALEVSGGGGFTVAAGPPGRIRVLRRLSWAGSTAPVVRQAWDGQTLKISVGCGRPAARGLHVYVQWPTCGIQVDVQVPREVAVRAAVGPGAITVRQVTGGLRLQATSGSVTMEGVRGQVWAQATSGAITGTALVSPQVQASVVSGLIGLQFAGAPERVSAAAGSGSVLVGVPHGDSYRVGGTAGSGRRTVARGLAGHATSREINVTVGSGSAAIGYRDPG